jgi:hypothetical protein
MNRWLLIILSGLAMDATVAARADVVTPVEGTWQKHEHTFSFSGFTTHYSCVGLESKLKTLLGLAGARPGYRVAGTCADAPGAPTRIQVVRLSFYTLAPAAGTAQAAQAEAGVGAWRTVNWGPLPSRDVDAGDCELVEQFAHDILPMFTTRDLESHMNCQPNEANLSGIRLRFSVLGPAPMERSAAATKTR